MATKNNILSHDRLLESLAQELIKKHKCHTIILYGSRARGDATQLSDYDLMGVRKTGKMYRVARKQDGFYVDIFVYPDRDLTKVDDRHLYMNGAKIVYEESTFGTKFLRKLKTAANKKFEPLSADEIEVRRVWLHKMYERTNVGDIEGNYRRSWLHESLLYEYFGIRKKRYWGSKQSFNWLKKNDLATYRLFEHVLANPMNQAKLKKLVERVSGRKIE